MKQTFHLTQNICNVPGEKIFISARMSCDWGGGVAQDGGGRQRGRGIKTLSHFSNLSRLPSSSRRFPPKPKKTHCGINLIISHGITVEVPGKLMPYDYDYDCEYDPTWRGNFSAMLRND